MKKLDTRLVKFIWKKLNKILIIAVFAILPTIFGLIWITKQKIEVSNEVKELENKIVSEVKISDTGLVYRMAEKSKYLKEFLPDEFEIFETLTLIEKISKRTNFKVESFSLERFDTSPDLLQTRKLNISGSGSVDSFMAFLKEYKYITGQIVSIDSVNLVGNLDVISDLSLNVFAYKPSIGDGMNNDTSSISQTDSKLLDIIEENTELKTSVNLDDRFNNKVNPFED
jgi:hypothetical protein